jgi:hypothetical protein
MQRYVYTELHEIFFGEFPIILTEWLEILVENTGRYRTTALRNWTPELVRKLNYVSNKTSVQLISGWTVYWEVILHNLQWIVPSHTVL